MESKESKNAQEGDATPQKIISSEISKDNMMSYIANYGSKVLVGDKRRIDNILSVVYYEEKDCLSSSGQGKDECTIIALNKIQDIEKIKQIYNIVRKKVESLNIVSS